jgi:hypothetical protein
LVWVGLCKVELGWVMLGKFWLVQATLVLKKCFFKSNLSIHSLQEEFFRKMSFNTLYGLKKTCHILN